MAVKTPKVILYHIPKCAGIWAKEALRRSLPKPNEDYGRCRGNGHINKFNLYREHAIPDGVVEEDKRGRLSVCFVRHPLTWYKSFWCFRVKTESYDPGFPVDLLMDDNYENFVLNVLRKFPNGFITELFQFYTGKDLSKINFIGKQENAENDLVEALKISGEEFDEGRLRRTKWINVAGSSPKFSELAKLSRDTEEAVLKAERWVIDTFYNDYV